MRLRSATDADRDPVFALGVQEETVWFGQAELSTGEVGEWVDDEGGVRRGEAGRGGRRCPWGRSRVRCAGPTFGGVLGRSRLD
jgi:hypothetical protein